MVEKIKAYQLNQGYVTEYGLVQRFKLLAPYALLRVYKDKISKDVVLDMDEDVLVYREEV